MVIFRFLFDFFSITSNFLTGFLETLITNEGDCKALCVSFFCFQFLCLSIFACVCVRTHMFFQVVLRKFDYFDNKKLDYSGTQVLSFLKCSPQLLDVQKVWRCVFLIVYYMSQRSWWQRTINAAGGRRKCSVMVENINKQETPGEYKPPTRYFSTLWTIFTFKVIVLNFWYIHSILSRS